MSSYVAPTRLSNRRSFPHLSSDLAAVILFSLLGLVVAAAFSAYGVATEVGLILGQLN